MPATIAPISEKQGKRLGRLQDAERLHAQAGLWLAKLRATYDADPFDHDAIALAAKGGSNAASDLDRALDDVASISDDLDYEASEARYAAVERDHRRRRL